MIDIRILAIFRNEKFRLSKKASSFVDKDIKLLTYTNQMLGLHRLIGGSTGPGLDCYVLIS